MTRHHKALERFKREGYVSYNTLQYLTKSKNPPDVIYKLRRKGHQIEAVWETRNGIRHVKGYRYYSEKAA